MENLYDIIGVSPSVSDEELDSAYKKLREKYGATHLVAAQNQG